MYVKPAAGEFHASVFGPIEGGEAHSSSQVDSSIVDLGSSVFFPEDANLPNGVLEQKPRMGATQ
jgi:hypothetical protein